MRNSRKPIGIAIACLIFIAPSYALAADSSTAKSKSNAAATSSASPANPGNNGQIKEARSEVREAAKVIKRLTADFEMRNTLSHAKAALIVPDYGRAALGLGGAGGQGVLMIHNDGKWTGPAFYNIGALNAGLEAGVEAGSVAFLVMSEKAMDGFRQANNFSLNADAGITFVEWSGRGQGAAGKGADVVVWSGTKGLYGGLAVDVSDIAWDKDANAAYYGRKVTADDIAGGDVQPPKSSKPLQAEFSALEAD